MTTLRRFCGRLALGATVLLLVACAPQPTATPLPPTATAAPTATPLPAGPTLTPAPTATRAPTPAPTADAYLGWQTVETELFTARLPAGWQVADLSEQDLAAMVAELEPYQEVIGWQPDPSEGSKGLDLVAFSDAESDVTHNLNIRHMPLGAQRFEDAGALLAMFAPQMGALGFEITGQRADLRTDDGQPMARLSYHLTPTLKGQVEARGEQYYVLTDTTLWVLTFTMTGMQVAAAPSEFEQSAQGFAPR